MAAAPRSAIIASIAIVIASLMSCRHAQLTPTPPSGRTEVRGTLTTMWGDPRQGNAQLRFRLVDQAGTAMELDIPDSVLAEAGGLRAVNNREVVVVFVTADRTVPVRVQSIRLASQ